MQPEGRGWVCGEVEHAPPLGGRPLFSPALQNDTTSCSTACEDQPAHSSRDTSASVRACLLADCCQPPVPSVCVRTEMRGELDLGAGELSDDRSCFLHHHQPP